MLPRQGSPPRNGWINIALMIRRKNEWPFSGRFSIPSPSAYSGPRERRCTNFAATNQSAVQHTRGRVSASTSGSVDSSCRTVLHPADSVSAVVRRYARHHRVHQLPHSVDLSQIRFGTFPPNSSSMLTSSSIRCMESSPRSSSRLVSAQWQRSLGSLPDDGQHSLYIRLLQPLCISSGKFLRRRLFFS